MLFERKIGEKFFSTSLRESHGSQRSQKIEILKILFLYIYENNICIAFFE